MIDFTKYNVKRIAQFKLEGRSNRWIADRMSINRNRVNEIIMTIRSNELTYGDVVSPSDDQLRDLFSSG